jgi:hypothetical protein
MDRFGRFFHSIMIGLPSWFVVGVLITFSPEFAKILNVQGVVSAGNAVMFCYLGLVFGDFTSGVMSQLLQSRRKVSFCNNRQAMRLFHGHTSRRFYGSHHHWHWLFFRHGCCR